MNTRTLFLALASWLAVVSAVRATGALPFDVVAAFHSADRVMLYALDPEERPGTGFHGFRIVAYRVIEDAATRQQLVDTLAQHVRAGGLGALCFTPNHGIRLISGHIIRDLVICYECGHVYIYATGLPMRATGIAGNANYLDALLSKDKAPTAPNPPVQTKR